MSVLASEADIQSRYPMEYQKLCKNLTVLGYENPSEPIQSALSNASAEVVTYAQQGDITHPILTQLALDVALYRICSTASMATKEIRQRFEDAQTTLRQIAKGDIKLTQSEAETVTTSPNSHATFFTNPKLFGRNLDL